MIKKPPNPLSKLHKKVVRHVAGCPIATQPHLIFYIKKTLIGKTRKTKVYETLKTCSNFLANYFTEQIQSLTLKKNYL
jgi:hypothetical protein